MTSWNIQTRNLKNKEQEKRTLPLLLILLIGVLSGCIRIGFDPTRSGSIHIGEPVLSKGISVQGDPIEPTDVFKTTDQRIYCSVEISGPNNVRLGARWYHEDELIYERVIDFGTQRRGVWWVVPAPDGKFPVGDYRVEIYLARDADRIVWFKVIE